MSKTLNQRIYETPAEIKKAIYNSGKQEAVDQVIERVKAESAINIAGITHYVVTDHQLDLIKKAVLEDT